MIKLLLTKLLFAITLNCQAPYVEHIGEPFIFHKYRVIKAIIEQESRNNTYQYNEKERAAGCMQIRPIYVKHCNQLTGSNYTTVDCYSREKSIEIFCKVVEYYTPNYNIDTACMVHNAGGISKQDYRNTRKYRKYVKKYYSKVKIDVREIK